jgi:hypothetical protein
MKRKSRKTTRPTATILEFPNAHNSTRRDDRLQPPRVLTHEAAEIWRSIVESLPSDRFDAGNAELLVHFCRVVATSGRLAVDVDRFERRKRLDADQMRAYLAAIGLARRNHQLLASLATKLRLTQSTTMRADAAGAKRRNRVLPVDKPWDRP